MFMERCGTRRCTILCRRATFVSLYCSAGTMAFSHSKYTDASHSCFNDVGRDSHQTHNNINTIHDQSVHIHFSLLGSKQASHRVRVDLSDNPSRTIYSSEQDQTHNNTSINEIIHTNIPLLGLQQTSHQIPANQPRLIPTPKT
jgi:hypothetical protein